MKYKKIVLPLAVCVFAVAMFCTPERKFQSFQEVTQKPMVNALSEDCDSLCDTPAFPDHSDWAEEQGLHLCDVQGYIAVYVQTPEDCAGRAVIVGKEVILTVVNKITGMIGDSNGDGNCNRSDILDFYNCFNGIESPDFNCFCSFDWDHDDDIDLKDMAAFQRAIGTGNTYWAQANGIN